MTTTSGEPSHFRPRVRIVSWMGGEHWYIDEKKFLRLEEAIRYCKVQGLDYEIVEDPNHYYRREEE